MSRVDARVTPRRPSHQAPWQGHVESCRRSAAKLIDWRNRWSPVLPRKGRWGSTAHSSLPCHHPLVSSRRFHLHVRNAVPWQGRCGRAPPGVQARDSSKVPANTAPTENRVSPPLLARQTSATVRSESHRCQRTDAVVYRFCRAPQRPAPTLRAASVGRRTFHRSMGALDQSSSRRNKGWSRGSRSTSPSFSCSLKRSGSPRRSIARPARNSTTERATVGAPSGT